MPTQPIFEEVRELLPGEYGAMIATRPPAVDHGLIQQARELVSAIKQQSSRRFFLVWRGSKIPRGAVIPSGIVAWTQHGIVRNRDGEEIGVYDRVEQFGGEDGERHKMIISILRSS